MTDSPQVIVESGPAVQVTILADSPVIIDVPQIEPIPGVDIIAGDTTVVEVQVPGAPGGPGEPGPPGVSHEQVAKIVLAGEILSGHVAVRAVSSSHVARGSNDNPAHIGLIVGITMNAALEDDPVTVVSAGWIDEPTFAFSPGAIYLGVNGALTQVAPTVGFLQQLAVAIDATRIVVNIQSPITLA